MIHQSLYLKQSYKVTKNCNLSINSQSFGRTLWIDSEKQDHTKESTCVSHKHNPICPEAYTHVTKSNTTERTESKRNQEYYTAYSENKIWNRDEININNNQLCKNWKEKKYYKQKLNFTCIWINVFLY